MTWPLGNSMSQQLHKQAGLPAVAAVGAKALSVGKKAWGIGKKAVSVGLAADSAHSMYKSVKNDATELKNNAYQPNVSNEPFQPKNWGASSQSYTDRNVKRVKTSAAEEEYQQPPNKLDVVKNTAKAGLGLGMAYMGHKTFNTGSALAKGSKDALAKGFSHIGIDDANNLVGANKAQSSFFRRTAKQGLNIGKGMKGLGLLAGAAGLAYGAKKGYTAYRQYKEQTNPQPPKYPVSESPIQGAQPASLENNGQYVRG